MAAALSSEAEEFGTKVRTFLGARPAFRSHEPPIQSLAVVHSTGGRRRSDARKHAPAVPSEDNGRAQPIAQLPSVCRGIESVRPR